jgi:hypothetical protein
VGKTVLLNKVRELASGFDYRAVLIEAHEGKPLAALLLPALRRVLISLDRMAQISQKAKRGLRVLKSFFDRLKLKYHDIEIGIDVDPETGIADSGSLEADLAEVFVAVGEAAADRHTAVALIIDEMQYLDEEELSALIMAMHQISQRQLPVVLVGAGLPQLVALAGRSKSYAERLFQFPEVGALQPIDAADAVQEPVQEQGVRFTEAALQEIIVQTKGYPYFLQEWGYQSWNLATQSPIGVDVIHRATRESIRRLDANFFRVRFDRLTPREKDYLRALADLGDTAQRSGDIAEHAEWVGFWVYGWIWPHLWLDRGIKPFTTRRPVRLPGITLESAADRSNSILFAIYAQGVLHPKLFHNELLMTESEWPALAVHFLSRHFVQRMR